MQKLEKVFKKYLERLYDIQIVRTKINKNIYYIYLIPRGYDGEYLQETSKMFKSLIELETYLLDTQHTQHKNYYDIMLKKYEERLDKDNIYGVGISDSDFRYFIEQYFLPKDYYIVDPISHTQANEVILEEILGKYSHQFNKDFKEYKQVKQYRSLIDNGPKK